MFVGTFDHTLDNKGRLTIPSRFRETLAGGLVVTRGFDPGSLQMLSRAEWDILAEKVEKFEDPDFWGDYNIIQPEQPIERTIERLSRKLQRRLEEQEEE